MTRRILVTGASGFLGRPLCAALTANGANVIALGGRDGDMADPAVFARVAPVEHVFHLAARTFVPDSWTDPTGFHRTNVLGTINALEYCRLAGARLTFVSAYLYGVPQVLPIPESAVPRPNNPYALTKHLAEQACAFYARHQGVPVVVVRPFNIYGPGQAPHFLIPEIIRQVQARTPIRVKDLAPRRDYVYVDDVVDALMKTQVVTEPYAVFNVGSGHSISVAEVIEAVQRVAGTQLPVESENGVRREELSDVCADISRARQVLGWTPTHTFDQGIAKILQVA